MLSVNRLKQAKSVNNNNKKVVLYLWRPPIPILVSFHSENLFNIFKYFYSRHLYISNIRNILVSWIIHFKQIGSDCQHHHLLALWPSPNDLTSLGFSFVIYKTNNRTYHIRLLWELSDTKSCVMYFAQNVLIAEYLLLLLLYCILLK